MQGNGEKICCGFGGSPADLDGLLLRDPPLSELEESEPGRRVDGRGAEAVGLGSNCGGVGVFGFEAGSGCGDDVGGSEAGSGCGDGVGVGGSETGSGCGDDVGGSETVSGCGVGVGASQAGSGVGVCGSEAGSGCGVGVGGSEAGSGCGDGSEAASDESSGSSSKEDSCLLISWRSSPSPELWSCWETSELTVSTFSCSSSSSLSSSDASSVLLTSVCSSSISCESSNPSCARALAMFLRCTRTCVRQGEWCLARIIWSWLGVEWAWGPPPLWMIPLFEDCWPGLGLLPRRRWLTTGEGPIWEGRILVAGHLSVKNQYQWVRKH